MICEQCKKRNASVCKSENLNGKTVTYSLCTDCAEKIHLQSDSENKKDKPPLQDFQKKEPHTCAGNQTSDKTAGRKKFCKACGLSYETFIGNGENVLNCPECYKTFSSEISEKLIWMHNKASYGGRVPYAMRLQREKEEKINNLRAELNLAIENENFEKALTLRDMIRAISST